MAGRQAPTLRSTLRTLEPCHLPPLREFTPSAFKVSAMVSIAAPAFLKITIWWITLSSPGRLKYQSSPLPEMTGTAPVKVFLSIEKRTSRSAIPSARTDLQLPSCSQKAAMAGEESVLFRPSDCSLTGWLRWADECIASRLRIHAS